MNVCILFLLSLFRVDSRIPVVSHGLYSVTVIILMLCSVPRLVSWSPYTGACVSSHMSPLCENASASLPF